MIQSQAEKNVNQSSMTASPQWPEKLWKRLFLILPSFQDCQWQCKNGKQRCAGFTLAAMIGRPKYIGAPNCVQGACHSCTCNDWGKTICKFISLHCHNSQAFRLFKVNHLLWLNLVFLLWMKNICPCLSQVLPLLPLIRLRASFYIVHTAAISAMRKTLAKESALYSVHKEA